MANSRKVGGKYRGKVCPSHPEHGGFRHRHSGQCIGCKKLHDDKTRWRLRAKYRLATSNPASFYGPKFIGEECEKHPEYGGLRYERTKECVKCRKIRSRLAATVGS